MAEHSGSDWNLLDKQGPQGDYAFVTCQGIAVNADGTVNNNPPDTSPWWQFANGDGHRMKSPFRIANTTNSNDLGQERVTSWTPRDSISWWSDGTSNQLCFGEKHYDESITSTDAYRTARLGACWDQIYGDCTIFCAWSGGGGVTFVTRTFDNTGAGGRYIARGKGESYPEPGTLFGSAHPSVCNFLVGDGSVQSLSTTSTHTHLRALADVSDGVAVSLW